MKWGEDEPFEDTETIVIVGNKYYVDIRIKKDAADLDWGAAGFKEWLKPPNEGAFSHFCSLSFSTLAFNNYSCKCRKLQSSIHTHLKLPTALRARHFR